MKGVILDTGEKYYTNLKDLFESINNRQKEYNWLITNCECYPKNCVYAEKLSNDYCWISGDELTDMVETENFQWIWAVLSGFEKNVIFDDVIVYELPYADGNGYLWNNPINLQHPLASVEIVAWDGSLTLLISKDNTIVEQFLNYYLLARDLKEYNSES